MGRGQQGRLLQSQDPEQAGRTGEQAPGRGGDRRTDAPVRVSPNGAQPCHHTVPERAAESVGL